MSKRERTPFSNKRNPSPRTKSDPTIKSNPGLSGITAQSSNSLTPTAASNPLFDTVGNWRRISKMIPRRRCSVVISDLHTLQQRGHANRQGTVVVTHYLQSLKVGRRKVFEVSCVMRLHCLE